MGSSIYSGKHLVRGGYIIIGHAAPQGRTDQTATYTYTSPPLVYVSGEVNQPGLYTLVPGSRINDAIQSAGGFTENADSSRINLAAIVQDGEQIDVPGLITLDETGHSPDINNATGTLIDINVATLEQLESLPEIGEIIGQLIIDYRNTNGSFTKIEEILDVPRIGPKTFDQIKDLITVGTFP